MAQQIQCDSVTGTTYASTIGAIEDNLNAWFTGDGDGLKRSDVDIYFVQSCDENGLWTVTAIITWDKT